MAVGGAENRVFVYPAAAGDPKPLAAHAAPIRALLFTPDGARVVSAGDDNLVKVSDVATAAEVHALSGHEAPATSLAIAADGKRLVSGGQDKTVKIWDIEAGTLLATLVDATQPVLSVAVSPDGAAVLTGAADNQIRVYRGGVLKLSADCPAPAAVAFADDSRNFLAACQDNRLRFFSEVEPRLLGAAGAAVRALAVSPDGATTYAASDDTLVHSWETQSGRPLRGLAHGGPALLMGLTPDGTAVVSAESGKLRVWNAETGAPTAAVDLPSAPTSLDLSPDGRKIAVATEGGLVQVFSRDGATLEKLAVPNATQIRFTSDGGAFVLGGAQKTLLVRPSPLAWATSQGGPITALATLPEGRFAAASADNRIVLRSAADGAEIQSIESPAPVAAAVSPDGSRLAVAGGDQRIRIYDPANGELLDEYEPAAAPFTSIAYRPDGQGLLTTSADGALTLWSVRNDDVRGAATAAFSMPAPAMSAAPLADNRTAAAVGQDRVVRFFEPPPPAFVDLIGHDGPVFGVAVDSTGTFAASASGDGTAIVWNLAEKKAVHRMQGHDGQVYSVAFQPHGGLVAAAAHDGVVILWEREDGKEVRRIEASKAPLFQVAFSPDGKQLFTAGADKILRVWDVETGGLVKSLEGHEDEIYGLAVRQDGRRLATSGYGGHVMVWDVESGSAAFKQQFSLPAYSLAIRPDGAQLAVGSADGKAYLVDLPEPAK
jgi:WD40 repeat protein